MLDCLLVYLWTNVSGQTSGPTQNCASKSNTSCEECLKNVTCLWCRSNLQCLDYPVRTILPSKSLCSLPEARWGLCWVNFQALIITISVIAGVIIIAVMVCCYRCCRTKKTMDTKADAAMEKQADARKVRQEERKNEMRLRHDEIRSKYGLNKENPYARFEDN
ncbi:hypothetical protein DPEC_G00135470 [Dallia pectoralis]|uniref:Uncharacterized protein n=1 Tax=Dallia pectoralis TaxID=75939 RepID=A0ACC2GL56_DALPE|nr:hypothetical protein DPEC_G00135470 [Dallia pectoralis]